MAGKQGYNPNRDKDGKFATGPLSAPPQKPIVPPLKGDYGLNDPGLTLQEQNAKLEQILEDTAARRKQGVTVFPTNTESVSDGGVGESVTQVTPANPVVRLEGESLADMRARIRRERAERKEAREAEFKEQWWKNTRERAAAQNIDLDSENDAFRERVQASRNNWDKTEYREFLKDKNPRKYQQFLEANGVKYPMNWDEMGASNKDLWEERQVESIFRMRARKKD